LGAFHLTGFRIAAMAKSLSIHLCHHSQDTLACLDFTLGKQSQVHDLSRCEQRRARVFAGRHTGAATDTGSRIKSCFGGRVTD
jgi:hypothetical protein